MDPTAGIPPNNDSTVSTLTPAPGDAGKDDGWGYNVCMGGGLGESLAHSVDCRVGKTEGNLCTLSDVKHCVNIKDN